VRDPLPADQQQPSAPFHVLIETSGSNSEHDVQVAYSQLLICIFCNKKFLRKKLQAFLEKSTEVGLVNRGVIAQDLSQVASI
jgi:hypothetical protein